ncbi:UvrD-helicase domain-containing protein [Reichenbachiella ulvae]|uniref:DNA 3'-5' helicase n=1 Tax=Reichenbachiella ulvae TaxID=2980104 RepID=A0ABT3CNF7_9BACT|nr:UvrD-helicase domain-containing protein [Reichenbachiella ulvae]MCV9385221.1 UvrD-helicase domain-containing protein [Reichenbachiella ulvae]
MEQDSSQSNFHIYRASAGSGKTYTLTYNYLRLALRYPEYFKSILAVTFTNKATQEMKSRIVDTLREISKSEPPMAKDLMEDLKMDAATLKQRADKVLKTLLHNYSFFAVTTIDAFFQKVVRSFAREIGIHSGFKIELDQNKVLSEVIDRLIQQISSDQQLLRWLTDFAISEINDGKSWDTNKSIMNLSRELFKDEVLSRRHEIFARLDDEGFMDRVIQNVSSKMNEFVSTCKELALAGVETIERYGLGIDSFTQKGKGVGGYLYALGRNGDLKEPNSYIENALKDDKWAPKTSKERDVVEQAVNSGLRDELQQLVDYYQKNIKAYKSLQQVSGQLYAFGLLSRIHQEIGDYKEDNDLLLISDFQLFLHEIINDSDSPYVYEKIGTRYKHYLIDEFQDTSGLHWDNFRPLVQDSLASGQFNMIVGDVKQSIYRWRGGDWDILLSRVKDGMDEQTIAEKTLAVNRRSKENIVKFNNEFFEAAPAIVEGGVMGKYEGSKVRIQEAYQSSSQQLWDESGEGLVRLQFFDKKEQEEGYEVEQLIKQVQFLQDNNYQLSDIAILVRKNTEGRKIAEALMSHRLNHPEDHYRYDVISNESLFIKNNKAVHLILQVVSYLQNRKEPLLQEQVRYALTALVEDQDQAESLWIEIEKQAPEWQKLRLSQLVNACVKVFDLLSRKEDLPYVLAFQDAVEDFLEYEADARLDFMRWWSDNSNRSITLSGEQDAMTIMTVHQSKGLQFKAVLLPYCNWLLDHGNIRPFLWSEEASDSNILGLPLVPVKYKTELTQTVFVKDYQAELHDIHLDNLNLLYVAMTRAEEVLYMCCPMDIGKKLFQHVGHLVYQYAQQQHLIEEDQLEVEIGKVGESSHSKEVDLIKPLVLEPKQSLHASSFELSLRHQRRILEESQIESINYGDIVHWIFSKIRKRSDFTTAIELAVTKFGLREDELEEIKKHLRQVWDLPQVSQWFSEDWEVKNEASILLADGKMKRPDRVVIKEGLALVIDYKTGFKSQGHIQQVEEYKSILHQMGYDQVKGYLIYFNQPELIAV